MLTIVSLLHSSLQSKPINDFINSISDFVILTLRVIDCVINMYIIVNLNTVVHVPSYVTLCYASNMDRQVQNKFLLISGC